MRTTHKFAFDIADTVKLDMPRNAKVLHFGHQRALGPGRLAVWAFVDTNQPVEERTFYLRGTGHEAPPFPVRHVASTVDEPFVWHLFEKLPPRSVGGI